ncbi:response regulator [Ilumatobacter sp.]|uniref:response regulator n=1 Tax=Ilumatobacter sp. TaxID=1967498 RepID=UPI003C31F943
MTSSERRVRVLIVDDEQLVRSGFRLILEGESDITVVGEAQDGREAIDHATSARPDVVLMDVQMPNLDGIEATRQITAGDAAPAVLVVTTFDRDDYLFEALRAGAAGFILKNAPPEELIDAVHRLAAGDGLISPSVTRRVVAEFARTRRVRPAADELEVFSERELEVLRQIAAGRSNAEIAEQLILGEATIKTHVSNILTKLNLRDRVQAVVWAYEHGIVTPSG